MDSTCKFCPPYSKQTKAEDVQPEKESQCRVAIFYAQLHPEDRCCAAGKARHLAKGSCSSHFHAKGLR